MKPQFIISDRSIIDASIHLKAMGDEEGANRLLKQVKSWISTYKYFFLLNPKDVPYKQDEIRHESEEVRNSIHLAFLDFFYKNDIPFILLGGSVEERLSILQQFLTK